MYVPHDRPLRGPPVVHSQFHVHISPLHPLHISSFSLELSVLSWFSCRYLCAMIPPIYSPSGTPRCSPLSSFVRAGFGSGFPRVDAFTACAALMAVSAIHASSYTSRASAARAEARFSLDAQFECKLPYYIGFIYLLS